jgi:hypothetical protein
MLVAKLKNLKKAIEEQNEPGVEIARRSKLSRAQW